MAKVGVYFVSCKQDPEKKLQFWIPDLSMIYSQCNHCGTMTGYGQANKQEHYDMYEIAVRKEKGMSYEDCFEVAEERIAANREQYLVVNHTPKSELEGKRLNRIKKDK